MHQVEFHVFRASMSEATYAVVEGEVGDPKLRSEGAFLPALIRAVTRWVKETEAGRDAWEGSSEDFNVGDLSLFTSDQALIGFLAGEGIHSLKVETRSGDALQDWSFDTILAEAPDEDED